MNTEKEILGAMDGAWMAEQALTLVEIPSVTMDEAEVCLCYASQLRDLGLEVDVREVTPGRSNLYARICGTGGGPTLNLNGHLDTIPIGDCTPVRREGDRIYGRGSTDMKSGMAAVLGAAKALLASGVRLKGDLLLSAVVGHEEPEANKDGPLALIEDIKSGRAACDRILIVEGADELWVMSMGSMVFTITLTSAKGGTHTNYVPFGENPIRFLGELIARITKRQEELDGGAAHPLAGTERIDLGIVQAGDYFNRTPSKLTLTGTRRWLPGKTAASVLTELKSLASPSAIAGDLKFSVEMVQEREPFETEQDDLSVEAAAWAHQVVVGDEAAFVGRRIVGDANLYVSGSGVPTFYYGPSNETAHSDNEWVSVERIENAAKVYALTAMQYCGVANEGAA
ncbi:MAG: M20/M25/M40 family metallo-hydrolase [bacterium]|nr:M20/M25/M40 family metallo-hydrolase [bacterium]